MIHVRDQRGGMSRGKCPRVISGEMIEGGCPKGMSYTLYNWIFLLNQDRGVELSFNLRIYLLCCPWSL